MGKDLCSSPMNNHKHSCYFILEPKSEPLKLKSIVYCSFHWDRSFYLALHRKQCLRQSLDDPQEKYMSHPPTRKCQSPSSGRMVWIQIGVRPVLQVFWVIMWEALLWFNCASVCSSALFPTCVFWKKRMFFFFYLAWVFSLKKNCFNVKCLYLYPKGSFI